MSEPLEPRRGVRGHLSVDEVSECAFGAEAGAAGLLEHLAECPACAREVRDVRSTLAVLAEFAEPEIPQDVVIRLDAAIEREWQQRDREAETAGAVAVGSGRSRRNWRRLRVSVAALAVICGGVAGFGVLISKTSGSQSASSTAAGSAASRPGAAAPNGALSGEGVGGFEGNTSTEPADSSLSALVAKLPHAEYSRLEEPNYAATAQAGGSAGVAGTACPTVPQHAGFELAAAAPEEQDGTAAFLAVYLPTSTEPAYGSAFAVLYAGSCPNEASKILDQGWISR